MRMQTAGFGLLKFQFSKRVFIQLFQRKPRRLIPLHELLIQEIIPELPMFEMVKRQTKFPPILPELVENLGSGLQLIFKNFIFGQFWKSAFSIKGLHLLHLLGEWLRSNSLQIIQIVFMKFGLVNIRTWRFPVDLICIRSYQFRYFILSIFHFIFIFHHFLLTKMCRGLFHHALSLYFIETRHRLCPSHVALSQVSPQIVYIWCSSHFGFHLLYLISEIWRLSCSQNIINCLQFFKLNCWNFNHGWSNELLYYSLIIIIFQYLLLQLLYMTSFARSFILNLFRLHDLEFGFQNDISCLLYFIILFSGSLGDADINVAEILVQNGLDQVRPASPLRGTAFHQSYHSLGFYFVQQRTWLLRFSKCVKIRIFFSCWFWCEMHLLFILVETGFAVEQIHLWENYMWIWQNQFCWRYIWNFGHFLEILTDQFQLQIGAQVFVNMKFRLKHISPCLDQTYPSSFPVLGGLSGTFWNLLWSISSLFHFL